MPKGALSKPTRAARKGRGITKGKNKVGRPTDYYDGLGDDMIALMKDGYSLTASAATLGFHRRRIYDWEEKHPEFAHAIKIARGLRLHKLETDLLAAKDAPTVTSRIFALKNADAEEWREKISVDNTSSDGTMGLSAAAVLTALKAKHASNDAK